MILLLGPYSPLFSWIDEREQTIQTEDRISTDFIERNRISWIVSYGYRHIIRQPILDAVAGRAINLHISLLPWNRGADPNFWSWLHGTPKGVSIHYIDEGVDTGDIAAQRRVEFDGAETFATSYAKLQLAIQDLFIDTWSLIKEGICPRIKQSEGGTMHRCADKLLFMHLLPNGWDTSVSAVEDYAEDVGLSQGFLRIYNEEVQRPS